MFCLMMSDVHFNHLTCIGSWPSGLVHCTAILLKQQAWVQPQAEHLPRIISRLSEIVCYHPGYLLPCCESFSVSCKMLEASYRWGVPQMLICRYRHHSCVYEELNVCTLLPVPLFFIFFKSVFIHL